jgi:hypothetical protein
VAVLAGAYRLIAFAPDSVAYDELVQVVTTARTIPARPVEVAA